MQKPAIENHQLQLELICSMSPCSPLILRNSMNLTQKQLTAAFNRCKESPLGKHSFVIYEQGAPAGRPPLPHEWRRSAGTHAVEECYHTRLPAVAIITQNVRISLLGTAQGLSLATRARGRVRFAASARRVIDATRRKRRLFNGLYLATR